MAEHFVPELGMECGARHQINPTPEEPGEILRQGLDVPTEPCSRQQPVQDVDVALRGGIASVSMRIDIDIEVDWNEADDTGLPWTFVDASAAPAAAEVRAGCG